MDQFWKYFHTVPSPDDSFIRQFFCLPGTMWTKAPSFQYSTERSSGFSLAGIPRVLAIAAARIFLERELPVPVFRHPKGVVITLSLSFSGTEVIFLSTVSHIIRGSSRNRSFSSSVKAFSTASLYFISTSSSTLGFRTQDTNRLCSIFSS